MKFLTLLLLVTSLNAFSLCEDSLPSEGLNILFIDDCDPSIEADQAIILQRNIIIGEEIDADALNLKFKALNDKINQIKYSSLPSINQEVYAVGGDYEITANRSLVSVTNADFTNGVLSDNHYKLQNTHHSIYSPEKDFTHLTAIYLSSGSCQVQFYSDQGGLGSLVSKIPNGGYNQRILGTTTNTNTEFTCKQFAADMYKVDISQISTQTNGSSDYFIVAP